MSALLNHLRTEYNINTEKLMTEIEDIVVKTIMSATAQMLPAINCFVPHNQNCFGNEFLIYLIFYNIEFIFITKHFILHCLIILHKKITSYFFIFYFYLHIFNIVLELYGFDILVDDKLKPWLLEVNLSPSLGIDSTLDSRIKSSMLCDLFTLIGIPIVDPTVFDCKGYLKKKFFA